MSYKQAMLRGALNGIIAGFILQAYSIMLWFDLLNNNIAFYSGGVLVAVAAFFTFKNQTVKRLCLSVLMSIIAYVVIFILLSLLKINVTVFKYIHGADAEMWAGDGIGVAFLMIINFWGGILGLCAATAYTVVKRIKSARAERRIKA